MKSNISKECYIRTAYQIILNEGPQALSIRRLAKELECNTANLYRYFKSLDELAAYASLQYLKDYLEELKVLLNSEESSLNKFIAIWECFTRYSFKSPEVFNNLFFRNHGGSLDEIVKDYYQMFPEDMRGMSQEDKESFLNGDFDYRNYLLALRCAKDGFFKMEDVDMVNRLSSSVYKGFLKELLDMKRAEEEVDDDLVEQFMECLKELVRHYVT